MSDLAAEQIRRWREQPVTMVRDLFQVEPDVWQAEALEAFPKNPRLALKAPICVNEMVWTPLGLRRWGDIQIGDELFAEDGSCAVVNRRFDTAVVPLFRVTFRDGTSLRVSADHLWDVQTPRDRHSNRRRTVTTEQLSDMRLRDAKSRQRLVSIPSQGAAHFPEASLPADPYVFGLWLGDGIANEPRLICPDSAIREQIVARGQSISESEAVAKRIGLLGWAAKLRSTGAMGCRSFEKYIPLAYKTSSVRQRLDLLRGMMDSDGTCALNGHTYLASCSERLIADFIWLARSLGFVAKRMGPYKINGGENRDSYRAVICGKTCPFLAATSKRKRWIAPKEGKTLRFIDSIKPDGEGFAMCVEIDHPSHCFQASDFIVTHNCKGPGKTAVLAWIGWNFLLTRPHPMCGATSINADNLRANLWTELARWREKAPLLRRTFEMTKTSIFSRDHPDTWKMEARTWAKDADASQIGNALAGVHAKYVLWLLDESGDYPDAILPTAEGIFSGEPIEAHIVQAGNPTRLSGPLFRACTVARKLWYVVEITGDPDDPKRSSRISIEHARQMIEQYGRDNPWVMVGILGKFPPSSLNALIGPDEVSTAQKRYYREYEIGNAPRILGVDVARFGDDASVIARRQGIQAFPFLKYRNLTSDQGAGQVSRQWQDWGAHACFIDDTGGYGAGWIDHLALLGRSPIGVGFAREAHDKSRYYNKRAEMYWDMVEWIKRGGALPDSPELLAALTQTTYSFVGDRMLLEPKAEVKVKLGYSPDEADALATTFSETVTIATQRTRVNHSAVNAPYDPFNMSLGSAVRDSYDPFRS